MTLLVASDGYLGGSTLSVATSGYIGGISYPAETLYSGGGDFRIYPRQIKKENDEAFFLAVLL
jgi:hypothetical protein